MTKDEKYISRCLQLARNGCCTVSPNPMVGAIIVHDDTIIGEGYHVRCGEAHAEVNALRSVPDERLLRESTLYVNLEPCAHYGKTPPCADLIIEKGIPRVVVGCIDPFPAVAGKGIEKLRKAGTEVVVGVLETACRNLNHRFFTFHTLKRPYITLKWAESADGFIDIVRTEGKPILLSNAYTTLLAHKRRTEHDAILVGRKTALLDDPSLSVRAWYGKNPVRMVIDKDLSLPPNLHLFDGQIQTWVFTHASVTPLDLPVEYIRLDFTRDILPQILDVLYRRKFQSLLVEGGSTLLQSFIDSDTWDEAYIEKAPVYLRNGVRAPFLEKKYLIGQEIRFGRIFKHAAYTKIPG